MGCTSLQFGQYEQPVLVPGPEGKSAEVWHRAQRLGASPLIANIRRERRPRITLVTGKESQRIILPTRYRWRDSFAAGLMCLTLAPICWGWDLATGTAWDVVSELSPEELVSFSQDPDRPRLLAIAPPLGPSDHMSDEVGRWLANHLNQDSPKDRVLDYDDTFGVFEDFRFTYEHRPSSQLDRLGLFSRLQITHVVESDLGTRLERKVVNYKVRDVITEKVISSGSLNVPEAVLKDAQERDHWWKRLGRDLIPNSASVDLATRQIDFELSTSQQFVTNSESIDGWLGGAAKFLGAFSVLNLLPPRSSGHFDYHFRLVPLLTASLAKYSTEGWQFIFPEETEFDWLQLRAGVGGHVSLETFFGNFYLEAGPVFGYSRLQWKSALDRGRLERGSIETAMGVGYYQYLSSRVALRIFLRQTLEDRRTFGEVLSRSQGQTFALNSVTERLVGLSVAYYFPEVNRWFRR